MSELAPLDILTGPESNASGDDLSDATRVIDATSARSSRSAPDIASRAGLSVSQVKLVLGLLEYDGRAKEREQGWVLAAGSRATVG